MSGLRFYLASGLDNADAARRLCNRLEAEGHQCQYRWWIHGAVLPDRMRETAELEMAGVMTADVVVILMPGGRGTHVELGIALASMKSIVLVGPTSTIRDRPVCFYAHKRVSLVLHDDVEIQTETLVALLAMHARERAA